MGRKDTLSMEYLSDNARFADICNYCLFDGQDVIQAEDLRKMDTKEFLELAGLSGKGQQILTREAALHNIEYAAAKVIEGFTDIKMDQDEKEEFNMCKAWTDHYQSGVREGLEQGRKEGRKEGREQGELRAIIKSSIKKFCKNIAADEAADMLEENVTLIERIYDAARMCAPDYDVDKIYAILQQ